MSNRHSSRGESAGLYATTAASCYALWGTIHVFVGATVLAKAAGAAPPDALRFLVDARPQSVPSALTPAVIALTEQHGWNLLWIGGTVATLAWPIFRQRPAAASWAFAIAGLADIGYLAAFVIPGFVKPATWIAGPTLWLAGGLFGWLARRARGGRGWAPDLPTAEPS